MEVRPPVLLLVTLVVGAASAQVATGDGASSYEGKIVRTISFDPPNQPIPPDEFDRLLPFHVGQPLKLEDVRTALQKIYQTGRFADASIDAEPRPNGVDIRISTELNFFVGGVMLDGAAN